MTQPQQIQHIQYLQERKHLCGSEPNKTLTLFDPHPDYWLASDIIKLYCADKFCFKSYDCISYFTQTILPNIFDYTPFKKSSPDDIIKNHVLECPEMKDTKLSRYAVYCIVNKYAPNNTIDLLYLISPHTPLSAIQTNALTFGRIGLRETLKEYEKTFSRMARRNDIPFDEAQKMLQTTLFGGYTITNMKTVYRIPENQPLSDYMGAWSLYAKINTIYDLSKNDYDKNIFSIALQDCAQTQRLKMVSKIGKAPEKDIQEHSIKQITKEFNEKKKLFIKNFAYEKLY